MILTGRLQSNISPTYCLLYLRYELVDEGLGLMQLSEYDDFSVFIVLLYQHFLQDLLDLYAVLRAIYLEGVEACYFIHFSLSALNYS